MDTTCTYALCVCVCAVMHAGIMGGWPGKDVDDAMNACQLARRSVGPPYRIPRCMHHAELAHSHPLACMHAFPLCRQGQAHVPCAYGLPHTHC